MLVITVNKPIIHLPLCVLFCLLFIRPVNSNGVALVGTWVLFAWCFVLLVRYSGAVGSHDAMLGTLLIVVTVGMMVEVVRSLVVDVLEDANSGRNTHREIQLSTVVNEAQADPEVEETVIVDRPTITL